MNLTSIENHLVNLSFGLLMIALISYWFNIIFPQSEQIGILARISTTITNIVIGIALLMRWITHGYFPLSNLYESLLFLSWGTTLVHLILEKQNNSKLIGAISSPISLFTIAFATMSLPIDMKKASPLVPALRSNWLMMHVSIMMISYATLIIGSLLSVLFLIVSRGKNINLKGKSYNYNSIHNAELKYNNTYIAYTENPKNINLLERIDNLSYRTIGLGFPLLTIGIIAGAIWANEAWGSYWSWDPKETWALITWLIFASYLHTRLTKSWQGKKPAILASIGFLVIWICYLGVNFLGKGLHSYGWLPF
uniref:Cytochrome c biogenesis protein CcsA n=2 Tax=Gelidium TaxID=2811 RepID=A0A411FSV0_9FLOR|nr:cytochrome c biogenesis protein [Gelidium coulteri]YP_009565253.1 cytochrome c biogenesis protein [Gelidium sinicola]QBA96204.1 cytochrome c biogenesis protein [Gelidium coulteri]QBA96604.1 cytochrome c biogenesis protein [Gelidium sinicola]